MIKVNEGRVELNGELPILWAEAECAVIALVRATTKRSDKEFAVKLLAKLSANVLMEEDQ